MQTELDKLYEDVRFLVAKTWHILIYFEKDAKPVSENQKKAKEFISETLKTVEADLYCLHDLIVEVSNCEDDCDLEILLNAIGKPEDVIN